MKKITFQFTAEELKVLQTLIEFHGGCEIPEWLSEEAYYSVCDKVLGD